MRWWFSGILLWVCGKSAIAGAMGRAAKQEQFYQQWSRLLKSGMPPLRSLEQMIRQGRGATVGFARQLVRDVFSGQPEEISSEGGAANFEYQILRVGWKTGHLPMVTELLARHFAVIATLHRQLVRRSLYPVFIFHVGAVLLALPPAVAARDPFVFFQQCGLALGFFYAAVFLVWGLLRIGSFLVDRSVFCDRIAFSLPILGRWRSEAVSVRLARLLAIHIQSGSGVLAALESAAGISRSACLRPALRRVREAVRGGASFSQEMAVGDMLADVLLEAIWTGEESGRLDEQVERAADILEKKWDDRLQTLAEWVPRLLYFGVLLLLAWRIIGLMSGYYQSLEGLLEDSF